jgi:predicted XRE-type DNA-binding protein
MRIRKSKGERGDVGIVMGSGNVFADLGLPNPEERLLKARLAIEISSLIESSRLSRRQAAKMLGIGQGRISDLLKGRLSRFSIERMFRSLKQLGQDIQITVRPSKHPSTTVEVLSRESA